MHAVYTFSCGHCRSLISVHAQLLDPRLERIEGPLDRKGGVFGVNGVSLTPRLIPLIDRVRPWPGEGGRRSPVTVLARAVRPDAIAKSARSMLPGNDDVDRPRKWRE